MKTRSRTLMWFYARLAVSLSLVYYFVSSIDFKGAWRPITPASWFYIGVTAVLANLDRLLMAYKWNILLKAKGLAVHFGEAIQSYYIGTFWGTFLPSGVGGDIVRAYRVARQSGQAEEIISSIVTERLLGMGATFALAFGSLCGFGVLFSRMHMSIFVGIALACIFCVAIVVLSFRYGDLIRNLLRAHTNYWTTKIGRVWDSYLSYRQQRGALVRFFLLSLGEQGFPVMSSLLIARALNLSLPLWSFFILIPVIFALSRIPVSINGFGVREGLYVYFFAYVGLNAADAFVLGLLTQLVVILSILPGFFYSFLCDSSRLAVPRQSLKYDTSTNSVTKVVR